MYFIYEVLFVREDIKYLIFQQFAIDYTDKVSKAKDLKDYPIIDLK